MFFALDHFDKRQPFQLHATAQIRLALEVQPREHLRRRRFIALGARLQPRCAFGFIFRRRSRRHCLDSSHIVTVVALQSSNYPAGRRFDVALLCQSLYLVSARLCPMLDHQALDHTRRKTAAFQRRTHAQFFGVGRLRRFNRILIQGNNNTGLFSV